MAEPAVQIGSEARMEVAREAAGVSRYWVEQQCGFASGYWAHMLGDISCVRELTLQIVAAALDVDATWLIGGHGAMTALPLPGYPAELPHPTALVGGKALAREEGRVPDDVLTFLQSQSFQGPKESAKWWYRRVAAELDGRPPPRRPGRSGRTGKRLVEQAAATSDLLTSLGLNEAELGRLISTSPNRVAAAWECSDRGVATQAILDVLRMKVSDGVTDPAGWVRLMESRQGVHRNG